MKGVGLMVTIDQEFAEEMEQELKEKDFFDFYEDHNTAEILFKYFKDENIFPNIGQLEHGKHHWLFINEKGRNKIYSEMNRMKTSLLNEIVIIDIGLKELENYGE